MKVSINVTDEMGDPSRCTNKKARDTGCMVAQALTKLCNPIYISVVEDCPIYVVQFADGLHDDSVRLPDEEADRIYGYDCGACIPAHTFTLDIPTWALKESAAK